MIWKDKMKAFFDIWYKVWQKLQRWKEKLLSQGVRGFDKSSGHVNTNLHHELFQTLKHFLWCCGEDDGLISMKTEKRKEEALLDQLEKTLQI